MKTDINVYNIEENPAAGTCILTGIPEITNPNLIIPNNVILIARRLEIDDPRIAEKYRMKINDIKILELNRMI